MNTSRSYIRSGVSAVNTDMSAYAAARNRVKKQTEYNQLLEKVEKLENCIENLKLRIQEMENNGDR